ncbi:conserved domain protein [Microcystis aeruginosa NIES-44]|uniref:Conserved domain protein n=2 Tax=Microcystis aeruginosa TaxID=1126 RepID=A0A0A1VR83_MICAE|nr:conserved domain protein [Microcystis aeruginosa NIES-44]
MNKTGTKNETNRINWLSQTLLKIPEGSRILDAGAGEQQFKNLCSHLNYVAQDFAQYNGQGNERGLQVGAWNQTQLDIISDITAIPEPDESFDAIMCVEVFEHLPEPLLALKEFSRLLRPNGNLIITAPFCSLTHFAPYYFYTGFSRYFYEYHIPKFGLTIVDFQENGNFFEYLAQEVRRVNWVAEKYSNITMNRWEKLVINSMLKILEKFSDRDKGSSELLSFGCHLLAIKK